MKMRRDLAIPDAEDIAIRALGFLASEPERLGRFLAVTGLGPENLRSAASDPRFLASVLDHVASDESLLLALAANLSLAPETVARANALLNPQDDFGA
jgi:hypothetical protein